MTSNLNSVAPITYVPVLLWPLNASWSLLSEGQNGHVDLRARTSPQVKRARVSCQEYASLQCSGRWSVSTGDGWTGWTGIRCAPQWISHFPITPSPSRPSDTSCMRQPQPEISLSLSLVDHYQNGRTTPSNQLENQPSYLWPYSIILPPSSLAPIWFYTVHRRQEEYPFTTSAC